MAALSFMPPPAVPPPPPPKQEEDYELAPLAGEAAAASANTSRRRSLSDSLRRSLPGLGRLSRRSTHVQARGGQQEIDGAREAHVLIPTGENGEARANGDTNGGANGTDSSNEVALAMPSGTEKDKVRPRVCQRFSPFHCSGNNGLCNRTAEQATLLQCCTDAWGRKLLVSLV